MVTGAKSLTGSPAGWRTTRVDGVGRHRAHDQRVAVGRRLGHQVGADVAARAGTVLDDDRLAQRAAHLLGQHAGHGVERAAGRVRHHEAQRRWEIGVLGLGGRAEGQRGGQRHGAAQQDATDGAAGKVHGVLLLSTLEWRLVAYRSGPTMKNRPKAAFHAGFAARQCRIWLRNSGAFVLRIVEELVRAVLLDDLATVHEDDAVGHLAREAHFVGHAQHGHAAFLARLTITSSTS